MFSFIHCLPIPSTTIFLCSRNKPQLGIFLMQKKNSLENNKQYSPHNYLGTLEKLRRCKIRQQNSQESIPSTFKYNRLIPVLLPCMVVLNFKSLKILYTFRNFVLFKIFSHTTYLDHIFPLPTSFRFVSSPYPSNFMFSISKQKTIKTKTILKQN